MKAGKYIAIVGLSLATGLGFGYAERDAIRNTVQQIPVEKQYMVVHEGKNRTPFLKDALTGSTQPINRRELGFIVGDAGHIFDNLNAGEVYYFTKKGIKSIDEHDRLELTVDGLLNLKEEHRIAALKKGLDYCTPETQNKFIGVVVKDQINEVMGTVIDEIEKTYDRLKEQADEAMEKHKPDNPDGNQEKPGGN